MKLWLKASIATWPSSTTLPRSLSWILWPLCQEHQKPKASGTTGKCIAPLVRWNIMGTLAVQHYAIFVTIFYTKILDFNKHYGFAVSEHDVQIPVSSTVVFSTLKFAMSWFLKWTPLFFSSISATFSHFRQIINAGEWMWLGFEQAIKAFKPCILWTKPCSIKKSNTL